MLVSIMSCCNSSTFIPGSAVFHLLAESAAAAAAATLHQLPDVSVHQSLTEPNDSSFAGVGAVRFCRLFRGAKLAPSIGLRTISAVIGPQGMTSSLLMMSLILALPKIGCGLAILSLTLVEVTSR